MRFWLAAFAFVAGRQGGFRLGRGRRGRSAKEGRAMRAPIALSARVALSVAVAAAPACAPRGAAQPAPSPVASCVTKGDCEAARALCAAGDASACAASGRLERACLLNVTACSELVFHARERGCEGAYDVESEWLRWACERRYPPACKLYADKLVDGVDLPRDTERAARLYGFVCDAEDAFPDFSPAGAGGARFPPEDPMAAQVSACVRNERLVELGLATPSARARTTPERALELDAERALRHRGRRRVPNRGVVSWQWLAWERVQAQPFSLAPEARAAAVREERKGYTLRICGPIGSAPAAGQR